MAPIVLSFLAEKGGVGRTTTSLNLVRALAERHRVLCIDADKQGSISQAYLGSVRFENIPKSHSLAELLDPHGDVDPEELIQPTSHPNVFVVPASRDMRFFVQLDPATPVQGRFAFRDFIHEVGDAFDFVHIDTPPDIHSRPTWNALVASHAVLTVVQPEAFSVQGLRGGMLVLQEVLRDNPSVRFMGYVVNGKRRLAVHTLFENQLRQIHGDQVFETCIDDLKEVKEANAAGQAVVEYAPESKAAKNTQRFAVELLARLKRHGLEPGKADKKRRAA